MTESYSSVKEHIRERRFIREPLVSLRKLMDSTEFGSYFNICSNRIADAELIDGEHVQINFINLDLQMDLIGFASCKDILISYVSVEYLNKVEQYVRLHSELAAGNNQMIKLLMDKSKKELKTMLNESMKCKNLQFAVSLIKEELEARGFVNSIRIKTKEILLKLYVAIKYKNLILSIKKAIREGETNATE